MDKVVRIECTVKAASESHAKSIFRLACDRLLHVHDWIRLNDCLLSASEHRDSYGAGIFRTVRKDDYINLTNQDMRPFGWMQVLSVTEHEDESGGEVVITARPVELPFDAESENYSEDASTLLRVVRSDLDVTACVIMEVNPFSTVFERLGVYAVQWRSLVNGILSDLTPVDEHEVEDIMGGESHLEQV